VTELFSDNLDELIPILDPMRKHIAKLSDDVSDAETNLKAQGAIAFAAKQGMEDLKQEFEYMKQRFSP